MDRSIPISGKTRLLGVIGSPVEHSQSPKIHNVSFDQSGVDAVYVAIEVDLENLPIVAPALMKMGMAGFNVTMPCKQAITEYVDQLSDAAHLIGAVNTVAIRNGKSYGDNTDGKGFWQNCRVHGFEVRNSKVLVLGAGGAGSAIYVEAALEGATEVFILSRRGANFDAAVKRCALVSESTGCIFHVLDLQDVDNLKDACDQCDIVVNCTKIGMSPDEGKSLVPPEYMREGMTVADVVYNPLETKMIKDAKELGLRVVPGLGMLLWQGAIAEEAWFPGIKMDVAAIQKTIGLD